MHMLCNCYCLCQEGGVSYMYSMIGWDGILVGERWLYVGSSGKVLWMGMI